MKTTLAFDFTEIGSVKSTQPLSGRGINFICQDLAGRYCYSVTQKAADALRAKFASTYTRDTGEVVS